MKFPVATAAILLALAPPLAAEPAPELLTVFSFQESVEALALYSDNTPAELLALNGMTAASMRAGQVLRLPMQPGAPPAANALSPAQARQVERVAASLHPDVQRTREVWRGPRGHRRIALTYDAGSDDKHAAELLAALRDARAPATFFLTGAFARKYPDLVRQITADGHPIYNHSLTHPPFTKLSAAEIARQLAEADAIISELTGQPTLPCWRPPFGDRDQRVLRAAAAEGYQSIYWTLDSHDSIGEEKSAAQILARLTNPPPARGQADDFLDGAIILMHVGKRGTAEAAPDIIRDYRSRGFTLVTISELLGASTQPSAATTRDSRTSDTRDDAPM